VTFGLLGYTSFGFINEADAQSNACRSLKNQLAKLSRSTGTGGNSREYRKYTDAIRRQQIELSKITKLAKRNRCTSRGLFKNRSAQCKRMVSSLNKMQSNLAGLQRTREKYAPKQAGNSRKRRAILAKLERFGCEADHRRQASASNEPKSRRRTIIEQVFGVRTYRDSGRLSATDDLQEQRVFGTTYRTLCVRKTDGYYFPISFSTTAKFFERDEQICRAMCPGVDVGLYHHHMPGQDSESMVAFGTKHPYAKEKFAFAYRKAIDNRAQCNFAVREDAIVSNTPKPRNGALAENAYVGIPEFKTDRTYSPDDSDVVIGNLTIEKIENILIAANAPEPDPAVAREQGNKNIRIVGPAFFPVQ